MRSVSGSGLEDASTDTSDFCDRLFGSGVTRPYSRVTKLVRTSVTRPLVKELQASELLPVRMPPGLDLKRTSRVLVPRLSDQRPFHPTTNWAISALPSATGVPSKMVVRSWCLSSTPPRRSPTAEGSRPDSAVRTIADAWLVWVLIRNRLLGRSLVST